MHTISRSSLPLGGTSPGKRHLGGDLGAALVGLVLRVLDVLVVWQERAEGRRHLAEMDARLLKDIGKTRGDIYAEIRKPFWQA